MVVVGTGLSLVSDCSWFLFELGRRLAPVFDSCSFIRSTTDAFSITATALAVFFHCLGFAIGCAIWSVIGWVL